jgi:hypothetical protein
MTRNEFPCVMDPTALGSANTTSDGTFSFWIQGKRPVYLRCVAPGFGATILGPIRTDEAPALIEIELALGGAIEGRARAKDGTPVVGAIVGITCGDAYPRTMRSGYDGAFRFEGLSAGKWLVIERDEEITDSSSIGTSPRPQPIEWSCEVHSGRTTQFDLNLDR